MNRKRHCGWIIALVLLGLVPTAHGQPKKSVSTKDYTDGDKKAIEFYIGDELVTPAFA